MSKIIGRCIAVLFIFSFIQPVAGQAHAANQGAPGAGLSPILWIVRKRVKPGRLGEHERLTARYAQAFEGAGSKVYWLGTVPLAGDRHEAMLIYGFDSLAALSATMTVTSATTRSSPARPAAR